MANAISLEYLNALRGTDNGLATLDSDGKIPESQLPDASIANYKGSFANEAVLVSAYPAGNIGDYAHNLETASYWYWNAALTTPAWVNQRISIADYDALSAAAKDGVPYIIMP